MSSSENQEKPPAISVIIPSYKPGAYITELLVALSKQTLNPATFEVLIVLNGEKEPYYHFIQEQITKLSLSNCVLLYEETAGVSNARNLVLGKAKGAFIAFLDDDDVITENYLSSLLNLSDEHTIAVSNTLYFDNTPAENLRGHLTDAFDKNKSRDYDLFAYRKFFSVCWAKLISKQIIADCKFDSYLANGEDSLFMALISTRVKNVRLANDDCVYYVRNRPESASRKAKKLSFILPQRLYVTFQYATLFFKKWSYSHFLFVISRIVASLIHMIKRT